eukprot:CAMPEP_0174268492 /NCGR_PEP_ID=MMETSP0439-20130205/37645_1 /TAXON_ID=0 /ORGANISM="Stereomyxa ramosa, Strain Chinc5" /LENGTH=139 /DNA_ID=CAMNT_0015356695 /DNA_START=745 /DNA_END=1164 /DNA_ORIENTATION=-
MIAHHLPDNEVEADVNVGIVLGGGLHVGTAKDATNKLTALGRDLDLVLQVDFVTNKNHGGAGALEPHNIGNKAAKKGGKGSTRHYTEADHEGLTGADVLVPQGTKLLLASGVHDVQQVGTPRHDHRLEVAVLDGGVVLS